MSVTVAQLLAFQAAVQQFAQSLAPVSSPSGPGQVLGNLPSEGVALFSSQGPTGTATVQSDDNHMLVRGVNNAVIFQMYAAVDPNNPLSTPQATFQLVDSPMARTSNYTACIDPNSLVTNITANQKKIVSSVQPYVKGQLKVTAGLWTVIACPVPATGLTVGVLPVDMNLAKIGGTAIALGNTVMAGSLPVTIASDQTAIPVSPSGTQAVSSIAQDGSYVLAEATTPATIGEVVYGLTNDGTPVYEEFPLGAGGRSIIVEGFAGAVPAPVIGGTTPAAQNVASLSVLNAPEALYLSGTIPLAAASSGNTGAISLVQAGGAVFDARLAVVTLTNTTGQIVNAASIQLSDTLNTVLVTDMYNAVAVNVPITTGSQRLLIPLPYGVSLKNLQLNVTLAGAVTGNVGYAITLLGPTAPPVSQQLPVTQTITSSTSSTQIIAAPGAGLSLYVRQVSISNTSAAQTNVSLQEGSGGTARFSVAVAANGGGWVQPFPGWWRLPANTGLFAQCGTSVADVRINVGDYIVAP